MPAIGIVAVVIGYLLGSVPVGYLLVWFRTGADLRDSGSGATGATNAGRVLGRAGFVVVFALDFAKGAGAVLVARWLDAPDWGVAGAGVAAVAGHLWPVWLRFRGGKGLATGFGTCLVLSPVTGGVAVLVLAVLFPLIRPALIPLVVAVVLAPVVALIVDRSASAGVLGLAVLILVGHRVNIRAILPGGVDRRRVGVRGVR